MPDMLKLYDLVVETQIGVYEWERLQKQKLWLDLELAIDAAKAAQKDDVGSAVDYGAIVTAVKNLVEHKTYHLMETVAEEVAQLLLREFHVPQAQVRVKKRALPGIDHACVEVSRSAGTPQRTPPSPTAGLRLRAVLGTRRNQK